MTGIRPTRMRQNGRMFLNVFSVALVLLLIFSACSADWWVGDGRGDWTLDLCAGYCISRINSREILIGYKENPNDAGASIVITNFFITAYQMHDPYICLEGIKTRSLSASDEELKNGPLCYYLIDTTNGDIIGPFDLEVSLADYCAAIKLDISDGWEQIDDKSS